MQMRLERQSAQIAPLDMFRQKNLLFALHVVSGKSGTMQIRIFVWTVQPVRAQQKELACAPLVIPDTRPMAEATAMLVALVYTRLRITKPVLLARAENL